LASAKLGHAQEGANPLPPANAASTAPRAALEAPVTSDADLRARIERLERQNQELMRALQLTSLQGGAPAPAATAPGVSRDDVKQIVADYMAAQKQTEKKPDPADGFRVGSDLSVKAAFNENGYLWFTTPGKDFTMHPGVWAQYDNVFWDQSALLKTAPGTRPGPKQGVASGIAAGGIGDLEDGTYFRRLRPFVEGTAWETVEYRLIFAVENDQLNTEGLDEFWIGVNQIPAIGTVRVGHVKTPMGFEADMTGSSRTMTFMERSSYSEAIEINQNFVTGIWASNNFLDQRVTLTGAAFRQDFASAEGVFFGDGQWGMQGRLTFLPLYECDGRHWLHLGISGGWRNGTNNLATSPDRLFQLRARPELRDDDPAGAGPGTVPDSNSNRMIDTGPIAAARQFISGLEFCYVRGPFSLQAEYGWNWIDNAYGIAPAGFALNPAIVPPANYMFYGGYVQLAYTITGEARGYDKKYGILSREYFGKQGNNTNAWMVWDENGHFNWGWGAWEVAARYSYVNLNDGTGLQRIQGGQMEGLSMALNWYLNNNVKLNFDWSYDHRFDVPVGTFSGYTSGLGMRCQISF
jgi:phosphate-selective porin OprO/OprP